jgi:hypothetical protein
MFIFIFQRLSGSFIPMALCIHLATITSAGQANGSPAKLLDDSPEKIIIGISDSGWGKFDHYWQYEVLTQSGFVRIVKEVLVERESESSDKKPQPDISDTSRQPYVSQIQSCSNGLKVDSPNGSYAANCTELLKPDHSPLRDKFLIVETANSKDVFEWKPKGWRGIDGFAWAPDSCCIAILNHSEHYSKTPIGVFFGASGHPIPYATVFLNIVDVKTGAIKEYKLRANVRYSSSEMRGWVKSDSSVPVHSTPENPH